MKIDYQKIEKEAARSGLSKFLLVKRLIGYDKNAGRGMCKNCKNICLPTFEGKKRLQCTIIGVGDDFYADVKSAWSCKKGYKLRQWKMEVIIDFLYDLR